MKFGGTYIDVTAFHIKTGITVKTTLIFDWTNKFKCLSILIKGYIKYYFLNIYILKIKFLYNYFIIFLDDIIISFSNLNSYLLNI